MKWNTIFSYSPQFCDLRRGCIASLFTDVLLIGLGNIFLVFVFPHCVCMRFANDVSELLVGSIFRSSKNIIIIKNDFMLGLYRNYGDRGGWG